MRTISSRFAVAVGGSVALIALTGCGATTLDSAAAASTHAKATPTCSASDLRATYKSEDAATSHRFGRIVLTNISGAACRTEGYGGLSYVGGGDGTQIGAPADRDPGTAVTSFDILPGGHASSQVSETTTGPYSRKQCRPRHVDGFRVYVPDETAALYVAHPTTGCAASKVHLLGHQAFRPGAADHRE